MKVVINKNRLFRSIPYALADIAIQERWVGDLAYYLHISSLYGNGIIYNYSSRTLSKKLGVGKSTVNNRVNFLLSIGLLELTKEGHLKGLSNRSLLEWCEDYLDKDLGSGMVTIKLHSYIKHTRANIYARVPLNGISQQRYVARRRAEVNDIGVKIADGSYITKKEIDLYNRNKHILNNNTENAKKFSGEKVNYLSDSWLSKETGLSISTVRGMVSFWVEQGLIKTTFVKGRVLDKYITPKSYQALYDTRYNEFKSTYYYKGNIVEFNKRAVDYGDNVWVKERVMGTPIVSDK